MGETRINLKHLLEDIRDSYPCSPEETIVTELIANALDSGASTIRFSVIPEQRTLVIVDDGEGMTGGNLKEYHDIAATTKVRGKGIGFAGVGVKLALLAAEEVITETKRGRSHKATSWRLTTAQRAPWTRIAPRGLVETVSGTAVSIVLKTAKADLFAPSGLLRDDFITRVIQTHFYPILDADFMKDLLGKVYRRGVVFFVNGERVILPEAGEAVQNIPFYIRFGRRRKYSGMGFIRKTEEELPDEQRGLAISTFGKIIKRGWDWVGISPRNPGHLTGIVEIPQLSEILTTNKADFLKDATSLKQYYRYRKAIQEAVEPILKTFGEMMPAQENRKSDVAPMEKEIERVLGHMLTDFPELGPLLGWQHKDEFLKGIIPEFEGVVSVAPGDEENLSDVVPEPEDENSSGPEVEHGKRDRGTRRRPGLMVGFMDDPDRHELGWLTENTLWINRGHSAYKRAVESGAGEYHEVLSVAWVLSGFLEGEKSPHVFINRFLANWGIGLSLPGTPGYHETL